MNAKQKADFIDELNSEFLKIGREQQQKAYEDYYTTVIGKLTQEGRDKKLSKKDINKIVDGTKISVKPLKAQIYASLVLSGISNVIENPKPSNEDRQSLLPILAIVGIYKLNAKKLAYKTNELVNGIISKKNNFKGLDSKALDNLKSYFNKNKKTLVSIMRESDKHIADINTKIKSNTTKSIQKKIRNELNKQIEYKVKEKGETITKKRFQTFQEVNQNIKQQFGDEIKYKVNRIVDTELKELQERTKAIQHLDMGYKYKKWNTQQDPRVRDSHRKINNKKIAIDKKFRVGSGWAMYPGDPSLPIKERINERCYLTYSRN